MVRRDTCRSAAACISETLRPYFVSGFVNGFGVVSVDSVTVCPPDA
jgi:hypothetical protein